MSQIATTVNFEVAIGDENVNPIPSEYVVVQKAKRVCTENLCSESSNDVEDVCRSQLVATIQTEAMLMFLRKSPSDKITRLKSGGDQSQNVNAPAVKADVKHPVAVTLSAEFVDPAQVSAWPAELASDFKDETTPVAFTGASAAPITCRTFIMKGSPEIRVELGTHSCTDMLCCAVTGCSTLVCLEHGFGEGFEISYYDEVEFPSPMCQQNGCQVVFCEKHFFKMTSCNSCDNVARATMELEGTSIPSELAKSFFCPAHATVRCNLRYRFNGEKLETQEANRERKAVIKDRECAERGDFVLGSMGLDGDCLLQEIVEKKSKREAIDDKRGIGHCTLMLCQGCLADEYRHRCHFDPDDFYSLF